MSGEMNWHQMDIEEVSGELKTDPRRGLTKEEAEERAKKYGPNALKKAPPRSILSMFLGQMTDVLVVILLVAAVISGLLGEWADTVVIMIIVVLNAILGVTQEYKAEQALKALQEMTKPTAKIIRDGMVMEVRAETLVPGDLILVDAGDFVPADARLVECASLQVNESVLTGESVPVEKDLANPGPGDIPPGDRTNMLFMGTTVTGGRGRALVVATGQATQLGQIAEMLSTVDTEPTPLQQQLGKLGKQLGLAAGFIVAIVFLTGLWRGEGVLEMFMTAVSLAVAAVPEGLPAFVTIVLALGVTRMSQRNVIIRKLPAVETLGTATFICSDKTGTLTKNEMTVKGIYTAAGSFAVTGTGYEPRGEFLDEEEREIDPGSHDRLQLMLLGGILNNDAQLENNGDNYRIIGDPTEGALVVAAAKAGLSKEEAGEKYQRLAEIPFDSQRKLMTTFHRLDGEIRAFTKGAPDVLLDRCTRVLAAGGEEILDGDYRAQLLELNGKLASRGERVLALGFRQWPEVPAQLEPEAVEQDLTFVGFFSMQDPARPEAAEAVAVSRQAGIRTVMITGDHPETATAIARDLGILQPGDRVLTGPQLNELDEEGLREAVLETSVYARVSPEHKLRIVTALKEQKHVVAMTGDGVNDAPALKRADIGVAMGITGTAVAKQASDMVLLDDNYATMVKAVEEGRTIYDNIRKSIQYLLSCNIGEIIAIFTAILLGLGSPLTPIQILWMNLITDGAPALALGLEPPERGIMKRRPRRPEEGILSGATAVNILWQGALIGLLSLTAYWLALRWGRTLTEAHTIAFVTMALSQLVHSFNVRSQTQSLFAIGLTSNINLVYAFFLSLVLQLAVVFLPFLQGIFGTTFLRLEDWGLIVGLCLVPLVAVEIAKRFTVDN